MDGIIWFLALITGAAIGTGTAFLITAMILNASNNKGDSRSKFEDFSSDIVFFNQQDGIRLNLQEFVNFTEWNIEALCKSQDYNTRMSTSLPIASADPVTRHIPGQNTGAAAVNSAVYSMVNGVQAVQREPVIFISDAASARAFKKVKIIEFDKSIDTTKYGAYRTLSGHDMTAAVYNSISADEATPAPVHTQISGMTGAPGSTTIGVPGSATIGAPRYSAPQARTTISMLSPMVAPLAAPMAAPAPQAPAPHAPTFQNPASATPMAAPENPSATMPPEPGPIYEAPTATRPLWENPNSNDDFSDFSDMM